MKNAIMAFLLYSFSVVVNAQARLSMPVVCGDTETWLRAIQKEYREQPYWTAPSDDNRSMYMLFLNEKTMTWTFVKLNEIVTCVIAAGDDGKPTKGK